jgi:drug/metabolite transporter (DMT)-like permease
MFSGLSSQEGIAVGLYTGIICTALSRVIVAAGLRSIDPSVVYTFSLLIPFFTGILEFLFLGQNISHFFFLGATITAFGVYLTQNKIRDQSKTKNNKELEV